MPAGEGSRYCATTKRYLLVELPLELPLPVEPLLEPVLGELGELELEPLEPIEPLLPPAALPVELPVELLPDAPLELLKWASHSARDTWPSLLASTSEKLGCDEPLEALEPPLAAGEDEEEDGLLEEDEDGLLLEPAELPPLEDGEVAEGVLDDDGLLDEDDDWATANVDSAKSTAAAVTLRVLRIWRSPADGGG